ncbi:hypothetical protein GGS20DRAFT_539656 [Poronia punctata]|nr:hypothetical protein GGS20DRAFT_539656 [Poronia punctata]
MSKDISYVQVDQDGRMLDRSSSSRLVQRPREKPGCWDAWIINGWLFEIASTFLGILFIIALIVVLLEYDGQPTPHFGAFGASLTLNTVAAILSTAAKAALLYPVAECVGQLKWIWFSKGRRELSDMSVFDRASRGIYGGLELLWKTRMRTFAVLGSFLMIYGITIDPLSQQLVTYSPLRVETPAYATIPIARGWREDMPGGVGAQGGMIIDGDRQDGFVASQISLMTKGAVLNSLYSNSNETARDLAPYCPTQNCTFPAYQSLAVCTSFADVSSHLREVNVSSEFPMYPIRHALTNTTYIYAPGILNVTSAAPDETKRPQSSDSWTDLTFSHSIAFKHARRPLTDMFILHPNGIEGEIDYHNGTILAGHTVYGAVEFVMEWCLQEYTTEVVNGIATTKRHHAKKLFTDDNPERHREWTIDGSSHGSLSRFLDRIFTGNVVNGYDQQFYASSDAAQALFEPYNTWQAHLTSQIFAMENGLRGTNRTGLELMVNNIATGLTNSIRSRSRDVANGTMYRDEIVVEVRWKWITAHVVFIGLCLVLLASTVVATHLSALKDHKWKLSTSAVLHALSPSLQLDTKGITTDSEMSSLDREQLVSLRHVEDEGWRLVSHDDKS